MKNDLLESLRSLLEEHTLDDEARPLRSTLAIGVSNALIARGDLDQAGTLLNAIVPADLEQRRALDAQQLVLTRARAERFERIGSLTEAIAGWQSIVDAWPTESAAYLALGRLYERTGEAENAVRAYLRLVEAVPTARSYLTVAARLERLTERLPEAPPARHLRLALVGNATLDHLSSYVRVECYRAGLRPILYQAAFDQVAQQILDPNSGLYGFEPEVLVCALHASRLFPRLHDDPSELSVDERRHEVDEGLASLEHLLDAFTQRSSAMVLVHNMVMPQYPATGILDWREQLGQSELFGEINRRIGQLARECFRNVFVVDEDRVQARAGKQAATDARQWLTARVAWSDSVHRGLAREYLRFVRPFRGLSRKCIVVDLDNTIWGGVIGEDGIDGVQLGADAPGNAYVALQRELERLWRRGIVLTICSKNNAEDVAAVFDRHPAMVLKWSHFAAHRINWQSKAANIREIAAELNIGLDSLVFLDDNPVERAAVRSELPEVLVPELPNDPALYRAALLDLDVFESLAITAEDRQRGRLYAEQAERRNFEASAAASSIEEYLVGLRIEVNIVSPNHGTIARIAQLTNKTNQFNVTTRRYTEAQIHELQAAGSDVFAIQVTDRFGDNGLVGVAIVNPVVNGKREIDTLLLSCRVMGRGVESALLNHVAERARSSGASHVVGRFIPTAKNAPARDCYARHGFALIRTDSDGSDVWELDLGQSDVPVAHWLRVMRPQEATDSPTAAGARF